MGREQRSFWVVASPLTGFEVPILDEDVAETFRGAGWEVRRLPLIALPVWMAERIPA